MTTAKAPARKPDLAEVLQVLEGIAGRPMWAERPEDPLVDHLLVGVLGLHSGEEKAREGIRALSQAFADLNEVRVSPLFELEEVLAPFVPEGRARRAANDVRMALQDVYDGTHGLDLEPLRDREPEDQRGFLKDLPNTPGGPAALVFQLALGDGKLALGPRERRLLERLAMLPRSSEARRVRAAVEKMVPSPRRYAFTWALGATGRLFEKGDLPPEEPFVKLLVACRAKELGEREKERKREEARRKAEERQRQVDEARRAKAEEIARKTREREEQKKLAEVRRQEAVRAKKAAALEAQRKAAEARKKAAEAKREAARKAAEAKKVEARRKAEARKADERKKAAAAAAAAKKAAAAKAAAAKKAAAKKAARARKK